MSRRGRGEGGIERLPSGSYRGTVYTGRKKDTGKAEKSQFTHRKRAMVVAWLRRTLAERDRGILADPGQTTLGEWLARWLAYKHARVDDGTYTSIESHCRLYLQQKLGRVRLRDLKPHVILDFLGTLELAKVGRGRQRNVGATLRSSLNDAVRQQVIPVNPMASLSLPKYAAPEMQFWNRDEAGRFLRECRRQERYGTLFMLALDTGMRIGELLGLHWPEVDLTDGSVRVVYKVQYLAGRWKRSEVKTKASRRRLTISGACLRQLRPHRDALERQGQDVQSGPVFPTRTGSYPQTGHLLLRHFRPLCQQAGVKPIRLHDLRHTHATLSLMAGASLRAVAARLGHSNPALTLQVYAHALPEQDQQITDFWDRLNNERLRARSRRE